jgi:NAD(P)-dependent dehydrogenase (short-subunit alcohol dehydrogenase family)
VLERGESAAITARDTGRLAGLAKAYPDTALALTLDVTDDEQVMAAVRQAEDAFGGIDVLVNNAGYGYRAAVEEGDPAARRSGAIVNISSIGALRCPPGSGYYSASKAALEAMTGSLRKEAEPLGIKVIAVEPGAFRTDFSGRSLMQSATAIDDYAETAGQRRKENDTVDGTQPGDPARAARAIIEVVAAPRPPSLLLLGRDALATATAVLDAQRAEVGEWRELTTSTDFED